MTSVFVPNKRQNLVAFMAVDSDATDPDNYGKIRVLQSPAENIAGPGQVANAFANDDVVKSSWRRTAWVTRSRSTAIC